MVIDFLKAVIEADREKAERCLSPEFGLCDGLLASDYITHEVAAFANLLLDHERELAFETEALDEGTVAVTVLGPDGLVFASRMHIDQRGLVTGNQHQAEFVPKFRFSNRGTVHRSAAVCSHRAGVSSAFITSLDPKSAPYAGYTDFDFRGSQISGDFASLRFELLDEDLLEKHVNLRISLSNGDRLRERVRFPGRNDFEKWQERSLFTMVEGNSVEIWDAKSRLWQVDVKLEDHTEYTFFRPDRNFARRFDAPVRKVIVTDALDNEWETEMPR
jgi:hypothetical protein